MLPQHEFTVYEAKQKIRYNLLLFPEQWEENKIEIKAVFNSIKCYLSKDEAFHLFIDIWLETNTDYFEYDDFMNDRIEVIQCKQ